MRVRDQIPGEILAVICVIAALFVVFGVVLPRGLVVLLVGVGAMALIYFSGVAYLLSRPGWIPPSMEKLPIVLGLLFPALVVGVLVYSYRSLLTPAAAVFALGLLFVFLYYWLVVPLALFQTFRRRNFRDDPEEWPAIAVVVPAYNEEGYVGDCIDSIRATTYPGPTSITVVDDGSTDDTYAEARAHAPEDATVIRTENRGKHAALNTALEHTTAPYIVSVDADSHVDADAFSQLIRRFFSYDDAGAVAGNIKVANRDSLVTSVQALEYIMGINTFRRAFDLVGTVTVVPGSLGAFRRDVLDDVGGYSGDTVTEDFDLTIDILRHGYSIRASTGIVYTEAPDTWRDLALQRRRWFHGNLQTLLKHRAVFTDSRYGLLHRVALPYVFLSMSVLPLLGVAILGLILLSLFTGGVGLLLQLAIFFVVLQVLLAVLAIQIEGEDLRLALFTPLTLFGYKQFLDGVLLWSLWALVRGERTWLRPARIRQRDKSDGSDGNGRTEHGESSRREP
ncbi:glycosyltransferase [Halosegnis longus]|uniref:glycosyltransferase n=1 Tax=Halosegnis longus TaxID=2216012 RepID=UPI00129E4795|nr:glycosyltransferase family 2 protein [Halosegnis longus]